MTSEEQKQFAKDMQAAEIHGLPRLEVSEIPTMPACKPPRPDVEPLLFDRIRAAISDGAGAVEAADLLIEAVKIIEEATARINELENPIVAMGTAPIHLQCVAEYEAGIRPTGTGQIIEPGGIVIPTLEGPKPTIKHLIVIEPDEFYQYEKIEAQKHYVLQIKEIRE